MASDGHGLPIAEYKRSGEAPYREDPELLKDRDVLVPDTLEWSGKKPYRDEFRRSPVDFVTPNGWELRLPCFDKPKGRVISTSTCTGLETPIMPYAPHAWDYLEVVEAAAEHYLRYCRIARVDLARDLWVPDSRDYLKERAKAAAQSGLEVEIYIKARQLGMTYHGVAGGDRLRVYHKGIEIRAKGMENLIVREVDDVIRVELQLRKGQLDDRLRKSVSMLRSSRVQPEPREADIPVIRIKPSHGHGIKRRHLHGMNRERLPRRALEATEAVDRFLMDQGHHLLLPGHIGVQMPHPRYGRKPMRPKRF